MSLFKSERGIGIIVASVMFLMISALFLGGTFLWQSTNQAHMTALDKDRTDERISVQATHKWNSTSKEYSVTVKVSNIGTIDVEFVRLWILDKDYNEHVGIDIYYPLSVGGHTSIVEIEIVELITLFDENEFNPDTPFNVTETTYYFKVVTARGNMAHSRLVPYCILESQLPAVIMPGASNVKNDKRIHLEVYNRLDENITIDMIVVTRYDGGLKTDIIYVEPQIDTYWTLMPGDITVRDFWGGDPSIYQKTKTVFLELINVAGLVVSSYYFTVQDS